MTPMMRAALVAALAAAPAGADERDKAALTAASDLPATAACLAAAHAPIDCVGRAAVACQRSPSARTEYDAALCHEIERDWWDARLNRAYAALLAQESMVGAGEDAEQAARRVEAARAMQRGWIAYRDGLCAFHARDAGVRIGRALTLLACLAAETARQSLVLEAAAAQRANGGAAASRRATASTANK